QGGTPAGLAGDPRGDAGEHPDADGNRGDRRLRQGAWAGEPRVQRAFPAGRGERVEHGARRNSGGDRSRAAARRGVRAGRAADDFERYSWLTKLSSTRLPVDTGRSEERRVGKRLGVT